MIVVFICGATGVGKSTLAKNLVKELRKTHSAAKICIDDYCRDKPDDIELDEYLRITNFEEMRMFHCDILANDIHGFFNKKNIHKPIFNGEIEKKVREKIIEPCDVLIVEGIFAINFANQYIKYDNSLKIFVETQTYYERFKRKAKRDIKQRGAKDEAFVKKKEQQGIAAAIYELDTQRNSADIIVTNHISNNEKFPDTLMEEIKGIILQIEERLINPLPPLIYR